MTEPSTLAAARVQLALNVDDREAAGASYTTLLGTPPAEQRPGYANFAVASPLAAHRPAASCSAGVAGTAPAAVPVPDLRRHSCPRT